MEKNEKKFSLKEVEKLVKNAYEVGFCDGEESSDNQEFREYRNAHDFWFKNMNTWIKGEINYGV